MLLHDENELAEIHLHVTYRELVLQHIYREWVEVQR